MLDCEALDCGALDPDRVWNEWEAVGEWAIPDPISRNIYPLLFHLAKIMKAKETLEIGIGRAFGTYVMGMYAKHNDAHHTSIDVANWCIGRALQLRTKFDLPIDILQCDSKAVVWRKKLNLIYIDGGHTYQQVKGDIENFCPWLVRNGMVVMHDYYNKRWEVQRAVDECFDPQVYQMMTWPWALGWALWRKL